MRIFQQLPRRFVLTHLLLLCAFALLSQVRINTREPGWINPIQINLNAVADTAEVTYGEFYLLMDHQINVGTEEDFFHWAIRVIQQSGLEGISPVSISYDPTFQQLHIHQVKTVRDGEEIDHLKHGEIIELRTEDDQARKIYDGSIAVSVELRDLRLGDLIEVSFTRKGFNPVFDGKFASAEELQFYSPIHRIYKRVMVPRDRDLQVAISYTDIKPIVKSGNVQTEYITDLTGVTAISVDDDTPDWYWPTAEFAVSEYRSWEEVRAWGNELFAQSSSANR